MHITLQSRHGFHKAPCLHGDVWRGSNAVSFCEDEYGRVSSLSGIHNSEMAQCVADLYAGKMLSLESGTIEVRRYVLAYRTHTKTPTQRRARSHVW